MVNLDLVDESNTFWVQEGKLHSDLCSTSKAVLKFVNVPPCDPGICHQPCSFLRVGKFLVDFFDCILIATNIKLQRGIPEEISRFRFCGLQNSANTDSTIES